MIIKGVPLEDLEAARDVASQLLGNELVFSEHHIYGPKKHGLRLQVGDIEGPGARRYSHMYLLGHSDKPRRSRYACTHAYGHLFVAIFERCPEARIHTSKADYRGFRDFLDKYVDAVDSNVGSLYMPIRYGDECTCPSDEMPTDTLTYWGPHAEIPHPENTLGTRLE
jgi:hypothetical protein